MFAFWFVFFFSGRKASFWFLFWKIMFSDFLCIESKFAVCRGAFFFTGSNFKFESRLEDSLRFSSTCLNRLETKSSRYSSWTRGGGDCNLSSDFKSFSSCVFWEKSITSLYFFGNASYPPLFTSDTFSFSPKDGKKPVVVDEDLVWYVTFPPDFANIDILDGST